MSNFPHLNTVWQAFAPPHVGDLRIILQNEFMRSFSDFTPDWRETCVFNFSPATMNTIRENLLEFNDKDYTAFIKWILGFVDSYFVPFQFAAFLQMDLTDGEFFDVIVAVMEYLKDAFETIANALNVNTNTEEYKRAFGSVEPVTYLVMKSSEMLFSHHGDKIMDTICKRVRFLRKCHSYHDSRFWNSLSDTSLAKVAEVLNEVPETESYGEFVQQFETELIEDVREYVKKIPLTISEKYFLLKMRECVDIEETIYNTLVSPDVEDYEECNSKILDCFRDQHERARAVFIFKNNDSDLTNPDVQFNPAYFRDIYALYVFRGEKASVENLQKLSSIIQESLVQILLKYVSPHEEAEPGPQSFECFAVALKEFAKHKTVIKSRLSQISDHGELTKALDKGCSELSLSHLSTMGYANRMGAAEEYAISFLCNGNIKTDDELATIALIIDYILFIPQHTRFMNKLFMKMRLSALQRHEVPMKRLINFINRAKFNGLVSKKVTCFIQDMDVSIGMGGKDATTFQDSSSGLNCDTCLVTRSRYWGSGMGKSEILLPCSHISHIRKRIAAHLEQKIDDDRRLVPMDCLSRVVLKTTLYTRGRPFTRLDMLQHQFMVLVLCEEEGPVRMSDIVRSMSAEKIKSEVERKQVQKFIRLMVESLMHPYPLLKISLAVEPDPRDPVLSINHSFAFQEENVHLPGDHLVLGAENGFQT